MNHTPNFDANQQQLADFNLDEYVIDDLLPIEELEFLPRTDLALLLSSWGKGNDGAELSTEQVRELIKGGTVLAKHRWGRLVILVLVDELLQRLFLMVDKEKCLPHFCFMTI
jgi:hypothetical protein